MLSGLPAPEEDGRIIRFPRAFIGDADDRPFSVVLRGGRPPRQEDVARRYLKFMLPSIPVTIFVMGFLYSSLLLSVQSGATAPVPASSTRASSAESALPLLGALLLALTAAVLCVMIYSGYQRICAQAD
ncbi:MAG: hypothetical protein IVW57_09375 [Ktedonobacterales bacterium]|nr:hypothetical protein [Ktedonobacterales bacterium]